MINSDPRLIEAFDRAAAALEMSADVVARSAELAEYYGGGDAASHGEKARWAREAAENGRRQVRRLHLRRQANELFGRPCPWATWLRSAAGPAPDPMMTLPTLDAAVIATDPAAIVRLWNEASERLYGWSAKEAIGRPIGELMVGPEDTEVAASILACVGRTGSWEGEFWVRRRDRTRILAYVRDVAVFDGDRPVGIVGVSVNLAPGSQLPASAPTPSVSSERSRDASTSTARVASRR